VQLYRAERLAVHRRGGRKRALGTRAPIVLPQGMNQCLSLDFVSDAPACGRRLCVLAVVDDFTRECPVLVADTSLSGLRIGRELDRIVRRIVSGCSAMIPEALLGSVSGRSGNRHLQIVRPASRV
jgi:putative transposase